ncbi:uncharacterized protein O3C94_007025 [Discoglossus pictus]
MSEMLQKSFSSKALKSVSKTASLRNMDSYSFIEKEYIKNLQKQVYLLELETTKRNDNEKLTKGGHRRLRGSHRIRGGHMACSKQRWTQGPVGANERASRAMGTSGGHRASLRATRDPQLCTKDQARRATSMQPKVTAEAEQMITQMKELQSQINTMQMELSLKESSINTVTGDIHVLRRHLHGLSDANMQEKRLLLEDVTQLKKLAEFSAQDMEHKETEREKIHDELHSTIRNVAVKDREAYNLQTQLQEKIKEHESVEETLVGKRSEFLRLQASLHQLEEKYLTTAQSVQDQIGADLRKEAEKLRYQLKEKQLSADEDKYLRNKIADDCGRLTKENGFLQSQVLEATKQLEKEQQLREDESMSRTKRISELTSGKEKERQLELTLSHLKRLVQEEREKVAAAQEQMLHVQQGRKSVELNGHSLRSQMTDFEKRLSRVQLENSQLRMEKTHLVEHISQLHKQIAARDDEVRRMQGHVDSLCYDMNSLQFRGDMEDSAQKEAWKQLSGITQGVHKIAATMSLK